MLVTGLLGLYPKGPCADMPGTSALRRFLFSQLLGSIVVVCCITVDGERKQQDTRIESDRVATLAWCMYSFFWALEPWQQTIGC